MQKVVVSQGGRVVIPAEVREKLNIHQGDELFCEIRDGELVLASKRERIRRVRDAFFATMPAGVRDISLADELVADRRREALRELSGNE